MSSAPYGVRLIVGVAATAVEETRKLPQNILAYPMTFVSQLAQLVMKVQQDVAELVIKGDATLETLFPPDDESPEWATFDEDEDIADGGSADGGSADGAAAPAARHPEGRFALYSDAERVTPTQDRPTPTSQAPAAATEIDYDTLTLAQLRARLQALSVDDLQALLTYEESGRARAPFQTLLANRITRATAR